MSSTGGAAAGSPLAAWDVLACLAGGAVTSVVTAALVGRLGPWGLPAVGLALPVGVVAGRVRGRRLVHACAAGLGWLLMFVPPALVASTYDTGRLGHLCTALLAGAVSAPVPGLLVFLGSRRRARATPAGRRTGPAAGRRGGGSGI